MRFCLIFLVKTTNYIDFQTDNTVKLFMWKSIDFQELMSVEE
jgi:hypothetical protein